MYTYTDVLDKYGENKICIINAGNFKNVMVLQGSFFPVVLWGHQI